MLIEQPSGKFAKKKMLIRLPDDQRLKNSEVIFLKSECVCCHKMYKAFNNRVLRLPLAIVLLNTTFRPGNSGLLQVSKNLQSMLPNR